MNKSTQTIESGRCAKCGYPRKEHSYNGACYGLCGEFVPPTINRDLDEAYQSLKWHLEWHLLHPDVEDDVRAILADYEQRKGSKIVVESQRTQRAKRIVDLLEEVARHGRGDWEVLFEFLDESQEVDEIRSWLLDWVHERREDDEEESETVAVLTEENGNGDK